MAVSSFPFDTSLNEWRHYLRDINFWLNGYLNCQAYDKLGSKTNTYYEQWNVGVGPTASFTRALSSIGRERRLRILGPFDTVIEVDMKQAAAQLGRNRLDIEEQLAIRVAEELGLLGQEYKRAKEEDDEVRYYSYGMGDAIDSVRKHIKSLYPQINQTLIMKKYLLVVENLNEPIKQGDFTTRVGLPPYEWKSSKCLISTTSKDVYDRSKTEDDRTFESFTGDDILMLTLHSLHQAAKHISKVIGHEEEQYWHHVALRCFHYAAMLLILHSSSPYRDGDQRSYNTLDGIASDELIRQWTAQGFITVIKPTDQERTGEVSEGYSGKCNYDSIYQVGNVILEAFREYSLLQLPFSPATKDDEATKSAAHFLVYHNLVAEYHTTDELCEANHPGLERKQWISHVGDQGWHVSREWLSEETHGPSSLILRHCSQQSRLFGKLDHLLANLPYLRVLDLSYTAIESLPPSVSCLQPLQLLYLSYTLLKSLPSSICSLQKLQLLSLRGCYNLTSPFSFSNTEVTVPENNSSKKINLLHLDLSYSNINTFHSDFFGHMPNLQELLLVKCSNLEELPPSIVALSSLTTLELIGTQIKSFPGEMFEAMKKLRSLKLIDNKILLFVPGSVFKACGLIDLHIEGCESITEVEVTLERHPTLRLFSFIGAPHIRRLSLCGCRKLEYVDIKEVGALEELDLSATAIKELPDNIPNLPKLRRLLLMGIPSLRRFPWHKLQRLPDMFCLDQCSAGTVNQSNPQVAQVCISDSKLFRSFNDATRHLVRDGQFLKTFYVRVTSCKATTRKIHDEEDTVTTNKLQVALPAYADVIRRYLTDRISMVSMNDVPRFRKTKRHVEISAVDRYPHGFKYLLEVTKSISMTDDTHVSCLHDLSDLKHLEECKLRRCHQMKRVFKDSNMPSLKNACVSHLKSLTYFQPQPRGIGFLFPFLLRRREHFIALKHLCLEHCPRLEGVMPRGSELPRLVTLDILFCYNLKAIFYAYPHSSSSSDYRLPCLRRIRLQELPLLEHLRVDNHVLTAPALEELHVRGCWSLRRLPRLRQKPDKAVKVSGERAWWAKLRWDWNNDGASSHRGSYEPRLPPASASIRERVVIKTYLR